MSIKRIFMVFTIVSMLLCLAGCCSHSWTEGNCTTPKTCTECGATEGDVVHNWEDAGCTESRICADCGEIGEPIGHTWVEATCTEAAFCKTCRETTGEPLGHTTKKGECARCKKEIDLLQYNDGFAIVTINDCVWMKESSDFVDICVVGTIKSISKTNEIVIIDSQEGCWTVDVGTDRDLNGYINTECVVFGFSSGGISSQHDTPLINMNHENNRIVFCDGKVLYPEVFDSLQQFDGKYTDNTSSGGESLVWIPTDGGTKYHSKSTCSGMEHPEQVAEKEAIKQGYSKCGKCW